ncbi:hypothetical protein [Chengkuizengella axinellae]|uniref:Uncharacterized protein n=1 Tax=Chengkuizengella axinellae TaxID=3064388 RepID=A0ABT9IX10_9BACL|nr:hypothetical protein [Chengkuizengella sp. 2205SS18-9]MDP5273875.1 hypothetical protein [Chengkuizengella sp. 2205SS18-9]
MILVSLIGCESTSDSEFESGMLTIQPIDFFKEDTKYLEPHLDWLTGRFEVKYSGPEKFMNLSIEVYEKGKLIDSRGLLRFDIKKNKEISFSIQDHKDQKELKKLIFTSEDLNDGGSGTYIFNIEFDDDVNSPSGIHYIEDEIKILEGNEAIIWGYFSTEEDYIDNSDELLNYDWVFVLKASLVDDLK